MTDALDPEEGHIHDDPFCPAANPGPGPHYYQGVADFIGQTGIYLVCVQCGDFFLMDGTSPQSGGPQQQAPAMPPGPNQSAPTTPPKTPWP